MCVCSWVEAGHFTGCSFARVVGVDFRWSVPVPLCSTVSVNIPNPLLPHMVSSSWCVQRQHYLHAEYYPRNHISNLECFRPREMSSKHPVPSESIAVPSRKTLPRDPRFDSLCGSFDEKVLLIILFWYRSSIWVWRCLTSDDSQKPFSSYCPSAPFISDGSHVVG